MNYSIFTLFKYCQSSRDY